MTQFDEGASPSIVLASASPRRRELLATLQLPFRVMPAPVDEEGVDEPTPQRLVQTLAQVKAEAVAKLHPDALVIGADTVVVLDGRVLGKPASAQEARSMLAALSGKRHQVMTGLSLIHRQSGTRRTEYEMTHVTFAPLSPKAIDRYVNTGEPMDKAGAYGIQGLGATLVQGIEGCYFNVVGLPLYRLARMLAAFGIIVP